MDEEGNISCVDKMCSKSHMNWHCWPFEHCQPLWARGGQESWKSKLKKSAIDAMPTPGYPHNTTDREAKKLVEAIVKCYCLNTTEVSKGPIEDRETQRVEEVIYPYGALLRFAHTLRCGLTQCHMLPSAGANLCGWAPSSILVEQLMEGKETAI